MILNLFYVKTKAKLLYYFIVAKMKIFINQGPLFKAYV